MSSSHQFNFIIFLLKLKEIVSHVKSGGYLM